MNIEYKSQFTESNIKSNEEFNDFIDNLLKKTFNNMRGIIIDGVNKIDKEYIKTRKNDLMSPYKWATTLNFVRGDLIGILQAIYSQNRPTFPVVRKDDAENIIRKYAENKAKEIQDSYRARLRDKLFNIFKNKILVDVQTLRLELREFYDATFKFIFDDGSSFTLNSQITTGYSNKGTFFYRFPSIYQNIVLADGTKYKKQSEDWMMKNFAGLDMSLIIQAKQQAKLNKQKDKKLYRQVEKFFGIMNSINDDIIDLKDSVFIDAGKKKYIKSLICNYPKGTIKYGQDPNATYTSIRFSYPKDAFITITYIDDTKIDISIDNISFTSNLKTAYVLNDKKINGNLGIEYSAIYGKVIKIHNMGKLTQELI